MTSNTTDLTVNQKICNRIFIINNLDRLINESVYYRNNSLDLNASDAVVIGNIEEAYIKKKIL